MTTTDINVYREKIEKILRQTNYTEDIAIKKLEEYNGDMIKVIKSYLNDGINKDQNTPIKSIQQEIYHQIRNHMNQPNKSSEYLTYKQ